MQQIVLVTGASSGLGKSIALHLHSLGYKVIGTSRTPAKYLNFPYDLLALDLASPSSIDLFMAELMSISSHIDVLINNAGVGITGAVEEVNMDALRANFETNLFGPLNLTQQILPFMRKLGNGKIINITSIGASMGLPFRGGYSSSKGALRIISEALRMEVAQFDIEVVTLAPGDYATDIASRRYHEPNKQGSPYEKLYQESLDTIDAHVDEGSDPQEIAEKVAKILRKKKTNPHYSSGTFLQRFSLTLKAILPQRMFERMLKNHYHLK